MNKYYLLIFLYLFISSCNSVHKISNSDRKNIISELNYIEAIDQKYAGIPPKDWIAKYGSDEAWKLFEDKRDSVGLDNQIRVKNLYNKYGYLGFEQVGEENSYKFWISIQHADNDVPFQKKILKVLEKEIKKNNAEKSHYALLEDRVATNKNKKQRFGTQLTYNESGQAIPKIGLSDSLNIDKLRLEYGLPTFKEYHNEMTIRHFEMNKEFFIKQGITEPKVFE
ncbi:DUF6624 domain-containing protein [Frigoriflavimonas asaccharolytica]|uniref:Uncharacterized protein n=1 Tax=Frigoriflavimonas asaccharolytica TaxID=2735899 RepID=A0A8J8G9E9_9FLAO|nr:DUF6624 domain-containing protein [Frigoriflavimonas asaccharolytica]NRS91690.1 hypothetical protein [Frigoriflavimonas asaccharolytica]